MEPEYTEDELHLMDVTVPYLTGMTEKDAAFALQNAKLNYRIVGEGDTVTDQLPASGSMIPGESTVVLYMGEEKPTDLVAVPDVTGMRLEDANAAITNAGLYIKLKGATTGGGSIVAANQECGGRRAGGARNRNHSGVYRLQCPGLTWEKKGCKTHEIVRIATGRFCGAGHSGPKFGDHWNQL